jgi:hypothetical protein
MAEEPTVNKFMILQYVFRAFLGTDDIVTPESLFSYYVAVPRL